MLCVPVLNRIETHEITLNYRSTIVLAPVHSVLMFEYNKTPVDVSFVPNAISLRHIFTIYNHDIMGRIISVMKNKSLIFVFG